MSIVNSSKLRILLVEDAHVFGPILGTMLRRAKFDVDLAYDDRTAVERWESGSYDVVIIDMQMPQLAGVTVTNAIRQKEQAVGSRTPIVGLTSHSTVAAIEAWFVADVDVYITKPVDFKAVLKALSDLVEHQKSN